jgi:hypothetical protein
MHNILSPAILTPRCRYSVSAHICVPLVGYRRSRPNPAEGRVRQAQPVGLKRELRKSRGRGLEVVAGRVAILGCSYRAAPVVACSRVSKDSYGIHLRGTVGGSEGCRRGRNCDRTSGCEMEFLSQRLDIREGCV